MRKIILPVIGCVIVVSFLVAILKYLRRYYRDKEGFLIDLESTFIILVIALLIMVVIFLCIHIINKKT